MIQDLTQTTGELMFNDSDSYNVHCRMHGNW